ncbi:MAG TPA: chemotaxis protein CheA [Malonomonas sp.]
MSHQALDEFLAESEELLEKLNRDLAVLGDGAATGGVNPDLVNGIFRDAHSFKGLAGMFGFNDIADLAHHLENLLDNLRLGKIDLTHQLVDCLFDSLEGLTSLVRGKAEDPDFTQDISAYLARIEHLLNGPATEQQNPLSELNIDAALLDVLTEYEEHRLQANLKQGANILLLKVSFSLMSFDTELAAMIDAVKLDGEVISTLPGCDNDNPENLAFRILCSTQNAPATFSEKLAIEGMVVDIVAGAKAAEPKAAKAPAAPVTQTTPQAKPVAAGRPGDVAAAETKEPAAQDESSARSFTSTVRVDIGKLDYLMTVVGELALAKGAISQLCSEMQEQGVSQGRDLEKAIHALDRRLNELQSGVMDVRMVPVRQLFDKMNRIVRRMAQELGKKVQLDIRGGDTELDKLIVEDLTDPLMHIIRNSLDHGIELPEHRTANGKTEAGTICLWASQRGNHVVIEIRDDGNGIDPKVLQKKGVEKGLLAEGANPTRQELFSLLFHPGFSTKDEVSEFSGRGVGMDVVKNNISSLSGLIELESEVGKGTVMSLTLPITLAIIKALVVRVRGKDYAIPLNSVLETLMLEPGMVQTIERREVMELRKQTLSLLHIDKLFNLQGDDSTKGQFVVVAGFADKRMGIVVDELRGQQDVVIKSLGKSLSFVKGIAGAADLGNQKTILVLDVGGLISETLQLEGALSV